MSSSSPQIYRPKPRRPFEQNGSTSPLLSPADGGDSQSEAPSRTHSILNLTSPTLLGIYSPGYDRDESSTPFGTGAQTPLLYNTSGLSLSSMAPNQRRKSIVPPFKPQQKQDPVADAVRLGSRTILLFALGLGYGLLVRHLHDDRQLAPFQVEGIIKPRNDWRYLVFWGVAGVALGSLLPWIDGFFADEGEVEDSTEVKKDDDASSGILSTDWIPVVRSIGAFVGIAFAIRKLPWASSLQASLTLALVNPVLWYLIDRSKPGFVLSFGVGLTGTALLLASNPDMMPSPASHTSRNSSIQHTQILGDFESWGMGAVVSRETVEGAVWIWSVLFCSCVCFGNIGRKFSLSTGKASTVNGNGPVGGKRR